MTDQTSTQLRLPRVARSRMLRVLLTAGASYLGRFGAGVVVLVTIPMAREVLSTDVFGVWMMLTALLGFFTFADLGIGNGVLNAMTQAHAQGDRTMQRHTLASGYLCTSFMGLLIGTLWIIWLYVAAEPTSVSGPIAADHRAEVLRALNLFAALLAVNVPASLIQKAQLGTQQGYWLGLTQFIAAIGSIVAVPWLLHRNALADELVLATLGIQTLCNVGSTVVWLRRSATFQGTMIWHWVDRDTLKSLLRTGSHFFALQIAVALAFQSDAIVLTQLMGQGAYGDFAVVQKLFLFLSMLMSSAMLGLWPAFGDAIARGEFSWVRTVLLRTVMAVAVVTALGVTTLSLSMDWIAMHWLHKPLAAVPGLILVLSLWTVVDAVGNVCGMFMNSANAVRVQVVLALLMATLAFAGKWWLVPLYGPTGAVAATLGAYLLVSAPGQIFIIRQVFSKRAQS